MKDNDIVKRLSMMECSTPRLLIRPFTVADIDSDYVGWFQDKESIRFLDVARRDLSKRSLKKAFKTSGKIEGSILFGIFDKTTEKKIGTMRVSRIDQWNGLAWVGYLIGNSASRGQGIATEALTSLSDCILTPGLFRKLQAGVASANPASSRVLEKSGFSRVAVFSKQLFDGFEYCDSFVYEKLRPTADFTEDEISARRRETFGTGPVK